MHVNWHLVNDMKLLSSENLRRPKQKVKEKKKEEVVKGERHREQT